MGWWKIKDVETGMVDFEHVCPTNKALVNAIPGKESEDALYNGDGPADLMGPTLEKINKKYENAWGRSAKKEEMKAVFNFCCNGYFRTKEMDKEESIIAFIENVFKEIKIN